MLHFFVRSTPRLTFWAALVCLTGLTLGCGSDESAKKDQANSLENFEGPSLTTTEEDGLIVERYTLDDDDKFDVVKYFEEYPDPDDESITKRRIRKKEVDVNSDGTFNIVRLYDKKGTPTKEKIDADLDGTFDSISYYDNGEMVKKERLTDDGSQVFETRHYSGGNILRVERDRNNDERIDYWEFYEEGVLDRIGRDIDGDGRADTWTHR